MTTAELNDLYLFILLALLIVCITAYNIARVRSERQCECDDDDDLDGYTFGGRADPPTEYKPFIEEKNDGANDK